MKMIMAAMLPVLLVGCESRPSMEPYAKWERADVTLVCANETIVALDPVSQTYVVRTKHWVGNLSPGVTPQSVCAQIGTVR